MNRLLDVRGLDAGYDKVPVVRGLDLHVDAGEVVALLGPNGAGKTTTLATISGLIPLLGGTIDVLGYSVEMVIAEKLVTAVQRGMANTRWRDFVDLHRIIRSRRLPGAQLVASTRLVADYRLATLAPLRDVLDGYGSVAQPRWAAWRTKQKLDDEAPEHIDEIVDSLVEFADPVLDGTAESLTWDPTSRAWR